MPHPGAGTDVTTVLSGEQWWVLLFVTAMTLVYLAGTVRLWERGVDWPVWRLPMWVLGWMCVALTLIGPLTGHDFTTHMAGHVLIGMLAPLLLVLAAPITLSLRALPVSTARLAARLLTSRPMAVLSHPVIAASLNIGGLWVLYRTDLHPAMAEHRWTHLLVHLHVLAAGCLFTFAVLGGPDPAPHRAAPPWRAAVFIAALAAHNILAKSLYADAPVGVGADEARMAAQVMYYGGIPVELALIVLICRSWLTPRSTRRGRRFIADHVPPAQARHSSRQSGWAS